MAKRLDGVDGWLVCLLLAIMSGCGPGSASSAADSLAKAAPVESVSPEERDRSVVAALLASEKFTQPRCRWLKHGAWIQASEQESYLYGAALEAGYILMDEVSTVHRAGKPEPVWRITITERGKQAISACGEPRPGSNGWGVPVSKRRLLSARYLGHDEASGDAAIYEIDYVWEPTLVGYKVTHRLTGRMKVEEGKYRTKAYLRKLASGWHVDRIDERGALPLD